MWDDMGLLCLEFVVCVMQGAGGNLRFRILSNSTSECGAVKRYPFRRCIQLRYPKIPISLTLYRRLGNVGCGLATLCWGRALTREGRNEKKKIWSYGRSVRPNRGISSLFFFLLLFAHVCGYRIGVLGGEFLPPFLLLARAFRLSQGAYSTKQQIGGHSISGCVHVYYSWYIDARANLL
jgi:hypothetical protein